MNRLTAATISLVVAAATLAGCSWISGSDDPYKGDAFYEAPDPIPSEPHGTLVRYQDFEDYEIAGAKVYRIMYTSRAISGDPIVVTGVASVPTGQAPEEGWPMISVSHSTTGIADPCAPSKRAGMNDFSTVAKKVGDRFVISATDFEGLGTPGRHPYLVGQSEGRSALDAVVASRELPDANGSKRFATVGYSQGGHASLWTSQLAASWTPQLELVATAAGAAASEVSLIFSAASTDPLGKYVYMVVAGISAAYPHVDPAEFLTPKALELLDVVDTECGPGVYRAFADYPVDELIRKDAFESAWPTLAETQNAGTQKTTDAPVLLIHSTGDDLIPVSHAETLRQRMCDNQQIVELRLINAGGHGRAGLNAYEHALAWIEGQFRGEPPTNGCPEPR